MSFSSNQQIVVDLFIAAYGRTPTQSGLDFFTSKLESKEMTASSIANFMMDIENNEEAATRYPSNVPTKDKVEEVFHNVLGRGTATAEGLAFWTNRVEHEDNYTMADLMREVLSSARNHTDDTKTLDNKSSVTAYFLSKIPTEEQAGKQPSLDSIVTDDSVNSAHIDIDNLLKEIISGNSKSNINSGLGVVSDSTTKGVSALDSGIHWDDNKNITFSFNSTIPNEYKNDDLLTTNWEELSNQQKTAVRNITSELNQLIDISLTETSNEGMIRFNVVDMSSRGEGVVGFAFFPSDGIGGDIFLSQEFNNTNSNYELGLDSGEGGYLTITHELGHALGLKHPFEGRVKLPNSEDDINHTIMSYTNRDNIAPEFLLQGSTIYLKTNFISSDLYSLYDISTLQSIYGVNTQTNTEDNIYTTKYTDYKIQTIWDAGGRDTIDLSNTKGANTIDLRSGTINSVDVYTLDDIITLHQQAVGNSNGNSWIRDKVTELYNKDLLYTGKDNFSIAQGVIIEDIKTGSGDDSITDNSVDNIIFTGSGDDKIYIGNGGFDHIDGGEGSDSVYINLMESEVTVEQIDEKYTIIADNFQTELINIELLYFADSISATILV